MTGSGSPSIPGHVAASPRAALATKDGEGPGHASVSREERHALICNAAYYLAERRGFADGDPSQDWLVAEKEVDQLLGLSRTS